MKKIILATVALLFSLNVTASFALCFKHGIAITNQSNDTVLFYVSPDPGYQPVVKPHQTYVLTGDSLMGCMDHFQSCLVSIDRTDPAPYDSTMIKSVPVGSMILYSHQGKGGYILLPYASNCD